jgi:signal transduction histidine kinase
MQTATRLPSVPRHRTPITAAERAHRDFGAAAAVDRVSSEFLMLASHEMRGPIAVLRGYLDMVSSGTLGEVNLRIAETIPLLLGKVDHLALLVEQILDAARVEDHRLTLRLEPVDLRDVAEECTATAAALAGAGHRLYLHLPDQAVTVLGDRLRLSAIVGNLLDNAIKYSPDGGLIAINVSAVRRTAALRISDTGLGIAEEDLETVFTRFGRIVTAANCHIDGAGVGLYLSRQMARMHGGDVELASEPAIGTDAVLRLPLYSAAGLAGPGADPDGTCRLKGAG